MHDCRVAGAHGSFPIVIDLQSLDQQDHVVGPDAPLTSKSNHETSSFKKINRPTKPPVLIHLREKARGLKKSSSRFHRSPNTDDPDNMNMVFFLRAPSFHRKLLRSSAADGLVIRVTDGVFLGRGPGAHLSVNHSRRHAHSLSLRQKMKKTPCHYTRIESS